MLDSLPTVSVLPMTVPEIAPGPVETGESARVEPRWGLPRGVIILVGIAAAVIAAAGIQAMAWLIGPSFLALTIVIAVSPLQGWLAGKGAPKWLTVIALVVVVYGVLLGIVLTLVVSVVQLGALVPRYQSQANALVQAAADALSRFGISDTGLRVAAHSLDWGKIAGFIASLLTQVGGLLTNLVFLMALLLFLSVEAGNVDRRLAAIGQDRPQTAAALRRFAGGTRKYLVVSTVFGLIVAVLDSAALAIMGIPLAVTWGLLSFITNYIPNIGFVLGLIPPALIALLQGGPGLMIGVIVVYAVLNTVVQELIQPRFVGDSVGLSITVTFLALAFWAWLVGPLGAILAIPLTLLVKAVLVDIDPRAGWADALLRDHPRG